MALLGEEVCSTMPQRDLTQGDNGSGGHHRGALRLHSLSLALLDTVQDRESLSFAFVLAEV